jgi:hypothetical protein
MPLVDLHIRSSELGFPTDLIPNHLAIGVDRATNAPKYVIFTGSDLIQSWFPSLVATYDDAPKDIEWAWYGDQSPRRWFRGLRMNNCTWSEPGGESTIDLYIDRKRRRILVTLQHGRRGSAVQPRATYSGNYHPGDLGLP